MRRLIRFQVSFTGLATLVLLSACGGARAVEEYESTVSGLEAQDVPDASEGLQPEDVFEVYVYGEDDLPKQYRVAADGSVVFPFIGRVEVEGLSPNQLSGKLSTLYAEQGVFKDPQLVVFIADVRSRTVSIVGAVKTPGTLQFTPNMTLVQAVSKAGGFTPLADSNSVLITRSRGGKRRRYTVPAAKVAEGRAKDFPLLAGDIVFVPERVF